MTTLWGIASVGAWSHDFAASIPTLPKREHKLVAVADSNEFRAQAFAKLHKIPNAYGHYRKLAQDENVEVVYITIDDVTLHLKVAKMLLKSGKHVLYKRPLTMSSKKMKELIILAKRRKRFLMEAIWSRCFPVYDMLRQELANGSIGVFNKIGIIFPLQMLDACNLNPRSEGGSINDFIAYAIQLVLLVLGHERPASILVRLKQNQTMIRLIFPNEREALLVSDMVKTYARIAGSKGIIELPSFWCPTNIKLMLGEMAVPLPIPVHKLNFYNSAGLAYMADEVRQCLKLDLRKSPKITNTNSLLIAEIHEEVNRIIKVTPLEDEPQLKDKRA